MRIRRLLIVMYIMYAMLNVFAGEKPDFSGEWVLNVKKSTLDDMGTGFLPSLMTVAQKNNEITIIKVFKREYEDDFIVDETLTMDGKENKSEFWNSPRTTTVTWSAKSDTMIIKSLIEFKDDGQASEMTIHEAWSFKDKSLSITHFSGSSWGERNITMIFDKRQTETNQDAEKK